MNLSGHKLEHMTSNVGCESIKCSHLINGFNIYSYIHIYIIFRKTVPLFCIYFTSDINIFRLQYPI